jgi:coenzyme F420-0:L-glutamate ligase/coenzyme F420-1:gamma-L-glutamate ligase
VAVADEIAAAANLVRADKAGGLPVVVVRGVAHAPGDGSAAELVMPPDRDLFR